MISVGKSSFLNGLFGIKYLESQGNTTTKFVTIIRYNPEIKKARFFKLSLQKRKYIEGYDYYQKGEIIEGEENIIEEIKKINKNQKESEEQK